MVNLPVMELRHLSCSAIPNMGRLEICLGVTFGSVYDENWSTPGAVQTAELSSQGGQGGRGQALAIVVVIGGARP